MSVVYYDFTQNQKNPKEYFLIGSQTKELDNGWLVIENDIEQYVRGILPIYHHPSISISSLFYGYNINWQLIENIEYIYPMVEILAPRDEIEKWLARNKYEEKFEDICNLA